MKKLLIAAIAAISALPVAAKGSDWTVKSKDGVEFRVMPTTVRVYENEHGSTQADALVEARGKSGIQRSRWGVTGCSSGFGLASVVTHSGGPEAGSQVYQWTLEGDRMYDEVSILVCFAALQHEKKIRAKKGSST